MPLLAAIAALTPLPPRVLRFFLASTLSFGPVGPAAGGDTLDPHTAVQPSGSLLRFGTAVALVGDELLIGRPGPGAGPRAPSGGLYVFRRDAAGRWVERAVLAPADVAWGDDFGAALAVDGRLLAVGAPGARGRRGAVYLFARTTRGTWVLRAKLTGGAGAPGDGFGAALALRGDLLLVGAPSHAGYRGRVVVFRRGVGGAWAEAGTLVSGDTSHMAFGRALALSDRYAYVGAAGLSGYYKPASTDVWPTPDTAPRVFVFRDSAGAFVAELPLEPADSAPGFGSALLADGAELLVSSSGQYGGQYSAVFRFQRGADGKWTQRQRLAPDNTSIDFGLALARTGRELLIGAPRDRSDTGAVYVFRYDSTAGRWSQVQRLSPTPGTIPFRRYGAPASRFGEVLAADGEFAVVGRPGVDNLEGAAAVLRRAPNGEWRQSDYLGDSPWNTRQPRVGRVVPCRGGHALVFSCRNADFVAYLPLTAIGGGQTPEIMHMISGVWGWTDTATGREFALVGRTNATAFVEVTDPVHPKYLGELPLTDGAEPSAWRDMKVYKNYAFIVADAAGDHHGMQVFDLTRLRAVRGTPAVFQETVHYDRLANAHTLAVDAATGFLYAAGANGAGESCGGGLHMIDARTPTRPTFAGCFTDTTKIGDASLRYVHETMCVRYHGPDARYRDRELCFNSSGGALVVVDVTDKSRPIPLGRASYPNVMFTHQGWLSDDQRYFFLNDEFDETAMRYRLGLAQTRTRTIVFDLTKLDDPVVAKEFFGSTAATDHNLYVRGRYMFQANYKAGLRVIDVADPKNPREVGYFDTAPELDDVTGFGGAWTNYPYFHSGIVAVASIDEGLFLIRFRPRAAAVGRATETKPR